MIREVGVNMIEIISVRGLVLLIIIAAAVVFITYVIIRYSIDIKVANERLKEYKTSIINTTYGSMAYTESGEGEPVLTVHGICGGYDQGIDMAKSIFGEGYRLICPSRFGYPGSGLPEDSTPKAQAEAYKEMLDSLGIEKAIILGHSAGGGPSLRFVMQYPERVKALILLSANLPVTDSRVYKNPPDFIYNDFPMWAMSATMKSFFRNMFGVGRKMYTSGTDNERKNLDNVIINTLPMSSRKAGILNDNKLTNPDTTINFGEYNLEEISVPVLFIHAKDDPMALYKYAEAAQKRIPGSKAALFESGGHPIFGHEEELCTKLKEFIKSSSK